MARGGTKEKVLLAIGIASTAVVLFLFILALTALANALKAWFG